MNRKLSLLLLFLGTCFINCPIQSQNSKTNSGEVTLADLEMKSCPIDTAASAVVLYDKCEISFIPAEFSFDVLYTRTLRLKVIQKAGVRFGEMIIPLYVNSSDTKKDEIREMKAFTYNLVNGKITKAKIDPKTVFEQKLSDFVILKKLAFPDVHAGSVLEITYEVRSPFKFRLHDWKFQWEIPVLYSECILKYTPFYLYTYLLKNASKFDEYREYAVDGLKKEFYNTSYNEGAYKFVMKNVPAFKEQDFISSENDYLITLHFQINTVTDTRGVPEDQCKTWDELAKLLMKDNDFGKYLSACQSAAQQILVDQKISGLPVGERFDPIVTWVKKNITWNGQQRIYSVSKVKDLLKRKTGNSAEINLFLCGMFKAAGIDAYPVILSTRGNSRVIKDYPFFEFFNYLMVNANVGDKWILTDGTEPLCGNSSFPTRCINGPGLMLNNEKTSWIDINPNISSIFEHHISLTFNAAKDSLDAEFTVTTKGYDALNLRNRIGNNRGKAVEYFSETGVEPADSGSIRNAGADSVMKPYIIRLTGKLPVETADQMLEVNPFCNLAVSKNPFDMPSRKYPVDVVYPKSRMLVMELDVPEGYTVKKLPEAFSRQDNLMAFSYTSIVSDNKITCQAVYSMKSAVYAPAEYVKLKQFYSEIVKKLNEKIYLEKKI
ncbi:MAG: transglutaminase domain-containing protein [Bacteroidales bacterium]